MPNTMTMLLAALTAGVVAACAPREAALLPPPQATEQQVARELRFIQQSLHSQACFAERRPTRPARRGAACAEVQVEGVRPTGA